MACTHVNFNGINAIVCGRKRLSVCVKCRAPSTRLCDWKLPAKKTCDQPLCDSCTHSPAPDKDLCPTHAAEWIARQQDLFVLTSTDSGVTK